MKKLLLPFCLIFFYSSSLLAQTPENALNFQNDNYVDISNIANDVKYLDAFTIEFWVKFDKDNNNDYNCFISSNQSDYGNRMNIRIGMPSEGVHGAAVVLLQTSDSNKEYIFGTTALGNNRCNHIAFTYDNQACSLFVNGQLEATKNIFFEFLPSDLLSLGQEFDKPNATTSQHYNGDLDDLKIWNYAKTQTQIEENRSHESVGNESGLLVYYNFNQGLAFGDNTNISSLENKAQPGVNGTFTNFDLDGAASNFVSGKCVMKVVGVSENDFLNKLSISPNPTTGKININNPEILSTIQIRNNLGQIVLQPRPTNSIDISELSKACYYMQITDVSGNTKTLKIIKQ